MIGKAGVAKNVAAIALFIVLVFGGILAIHGVNQTMARREEARRVMAAERRLAEEKESQRIEMEAAQERARLAQEQAQEEKRLAEAKDQEQKRLAHEAEQKRLAEIEQERILSQLPVVLNSNNFVVLSFGKGTLFDCNGDGLRFLENRLDRPTPWATLTEDDAKAVLRTQAGFDAATKFGPSANIAPDFYSTNLEQQMGEIWRRSHSLNERLTTRMEILEICEKYNEARARYFAAFASSGAYATAAQKATNAANQAAAKNSMGSFMALSPSLRQSYVSGPNLFASSSEMLGNLAANQIMANSGRRDYTKANQYSQISSTQSGIATSADRDLNGYITRLAELGVKLPDSAMYPVIPPLNLRREIAVTLNSIPKPYALTNTPPTDDIKGR